MTLLLPSFERQKCGVIEDRNGQGAGEAADDARVEPLFRSGCELATPPRILCECSGLVFRSCSGGIHGVDSPEVGARNLVCGHEGA